MPVLDAMTEQVSIETEEKIFKVWNTNDGYNIEIDDISVNIRDNDDLYTLVSKLEEKKKDLMDIRFYHKDHIITLDEKLKEVLTFDETIYVFINGQEYVLDYNNSFLRSGNSLYNDDRFVKALEKFNIAVKRHPLKIKGLANRALCFQRLDQDQKAIDDCNKFLEIYETLSSELQKTDGELLHRVYYRKAKSLYKMAMKILKLSSSDEEFEGQKDPISLLEEALDCNLKYKSMIDETEFERASSNLNELYITINYILNAKKEIPACLLCLESKETVDTFIFPEIKTPLKLCCKECNEKIKIIEDQFIEKVYKPFYENDKEFTVQGTQEWLFKYLIILTWKNISIQDLRDMRFNDKPFTLMNKYHMMRNYILKGEWIQLDCYLYYTSKNPPNQSNESLMQYLTGFNFDYHVQNDRVQFVHSQLKHLHIVTLIHDSTFDWDTEKKVLENEYSYKFEGEENRNYTLSQPLIDLIYEKTGLN